MNTQQLRRGSANTITATQQESLRPPLRHPAPWRLTVRSPILLLHVVLLLLLLLLLLLSPVVYAKQLTVLVQPVNSIAGEPLQLQPVVALTDDDGNILTTINDGTVRAQIGAAPSRFASVLPAANSVPFVDGIARFSDLYINQVGVAYTIRVVSIYHGVRAETASFDIVVGESYRLFIIADISTAFGGTPFRPQPAVAVVDRGGNTVPSVNSGSVTLKILKNPAGGQLLPATTLTVRIVAGVAKFLGLFIDVAGSPYYLRYTTDLVLPGGSFVDTNPFTVAAGVCNQLVLLSSPTESTGGKAFGIQPVLKLMDAGGNTLEDDSSSYIKVAIASNPSSGVIAPVDSLIATVRRGIAIFRSLRIDKAGNDYSLQFMLYTKDATRALWTKTAIELLSQPFNIIVGRPVALFVRQNLSDGVLDGQPNERQPLLELLDAGGNIVSSIVTGNVVATMVPSAAIASAIVVDTSGAPSITVLDVRALPTPGFASPYGVGMLLSIQITFSDEVIASGVPALALASSNNGGANGVAECVTVNVWSTKLVFQYYVVATDATNDLDYISTSALSLTGSAVIRDRNGRTPQLALPTPGSANSLAGTSDIAIDTTPPSIVSVSCASPGDGEYGYGEEIYLRVLYSAPVSVYGTPVLPVVLAAIGNGAARRDAVFSSGNNTDTLVFRYVVEMGDATGAAPAVLDVSSPIVLATDMYIKRYSTRPTMDVLAAMVTTASGNTLAVRNKITIDTAIPVVDPLVGVTAVSSNGFYTPGDTIKIVVTFTKPVRVAGFPRVYMETGSIKRPAGYKSGDGTKSLVFAYTVAAYDSHSATGNAFLNYRDNNALDLNGATITRLIQSGSVSAFADVSLAPATLAGRALRDNAQIQLDALAAKATAVAVVDPAPGTTVVRGDVVTISISFSSRVTVGTSSSGGAAPSLALAVGDYNRQAVYVSGSGSLALLFQYTVQLGDVAALGVDYRDTTSLQLNGATIKKTSAQPTMDADLTLPAPALALANPAVVVDPTVGFVTKIVSLTADVAAGAYGSNQVISFSVTFTDEVAVDNQPELKLNSGVSVPYIAGTATRTLVFMHIVKDGEFSPNLDKLDDLALDCDLPACSIMNYNGELVDLSLVGVNLSPANIVIDTAPPQVVDVYALTPASTINGGSFVVGDEIDLIVEMDAPVFIDPPTSAYPEKAPQLMLNTIANGGRAVLCIGFYQNDKKRLHFKYTVEEGDVQADLTYVDEDSLTLNNGQSAIKRFSTTPKTDALLTLPAPQPLGQKLSLGVLNVDSRKIPTVLSVTSTAPNGAYRAGDVIELVVDFSQHVVVHGTPYLWLDLGAYARKATYVRGSGSTSLVLAYVVQEDDYTVDLEYIDHHSLDASAASDAILHASTNPTTLANLDLPYPFTQHSLSFNKNLMINGRKPTITAARFVNTDGVYVYNDKLVMELVFDACVVVVPAVGTGKLPQLKFQPSLEGALSVITRYAGYVSGSPGTSLRFEYTVKTGDTSLDLDYASAKAVLLNGAKILTCTADLANVAPVQPVETHLNPPGGRLLGDTIKPITFGKVLFTDLLVNRLGFDYEIRYQTSIGGATLVAVNRFDVLYSAAFGLRSSPFASGDALGSSVDVDGDTLVMGAPSAKEPISAVQIITAMGDSTEYVDEIQVIQTTARQRPAIQEITSSASPGETLGGWFHVKIGSIGPTRRLHYNFDETQMRVALELDLGFGQDTIKVSRTENTFCACSNAYIWTITFSFVEGYFPPLTTINALTGRLATVGDGRGALQARILVDSTAISGFFTLQTNGLVTRNIKHNVPEAELLTILTQDLNLPVSRVLRSQVSRVGGYTWSVTFTASDSLYDVAELIPQSVGLLAFEAKCSVRTLRQGLGRLGGVFRLRFRNDLFPMDETEDIPVTASDLAVETALEKLVSINDVRVVRSTAMNAYGGYSWTITFLQVNTKNDYGPVVDASGNLPALVPVTTATVNNRPHTPILRGTSARIEVKVGGYELPPIADGLTHWGLPGDDAGLATVFVRASNDWKQQGGTLAGADTRAGDRFGSSVSLKGDHLLVGAPFAAIFGDYEIQNLLCDADGGFFRIVYRGRRSEAIPFNADKPTLRAAIVEVMSVQFSDIDVLTPFTAVCSAGNTNEISIAIRNGDHGDLSGNILDLVADGAATLTKTVNGPASVQMREYKTGTYRSDGENAKGIQVGASYLFRRDVATKTWSQTAKLSPPPKELFDIREFGKSVAVHDTFLAVGAPGAYLDEGRVFVYQYNAASLSWTLFQVFTAAPYESQQGDRFGEAVAITAHPLGTVTIVVGAPGYDSSSGAVFVFDLIDGGFRNRQFMLQITPELRKGDRFGCSLDVDMATTFTLVVGANRNSYKSGTDSGAAFVFTRRSPMDTFFTLQQMLFGSDTRTRDRFGSSVAVSKDTVVVGAHVEYKGPRTIRKPVQSVTIDVSKGEEYKLSGGTFVLKLKRVVTQQFLKNETVANSVTKVSSRALAYNLGAASMRVALESDFPFLGKLLVTREGPQPATNGYTWYITFAGSTSELPLLEIDGRKLSVQPTAPVAQPKRSTLVRATARVRWVVRVAPVLRGNVYVFTRRNSNGRWTEQMSLYPREKQYFSWFGASVALHQRTAIIGAPNLDTYETGVNSGGGFVYDLGILSLGFTARSYSVLEGSDVDVPVQRCSRNGGSCAIDVVTSPRLFVNLDTGDAFSDLASRHTHVSMTRHIGPYGKMTQLEGIPNSADSFFAPFVAGQEPFPQTQRGRWLVADHVGTANARNQFYGSTAERRSLWVDAKFDYAGVSDYMASAVELYFDVDDLVQTFKVSTTSDFVVEDPDETVQLRLSLPGIWPSYGGSLWSTLTIRDNGDGGSGTRSSLDTLIAAQSPRSQQSQSQFSAAVSVFHAGNVAIVGAPLESQVLVSGAVVQCGAAYVYVRRLGLWELETKLTPPGGDCVDGMKFGISVCIDGTLGSIRAIIGAPGVAAAYVFGRRGSVFAPTWSFEAKLVDPSGVVSSHTYAFAGHRGVALAGDIAVVGAALAERIFVYHRTLNGWEFITQLFCSDRVVHRILEQDVEQSYRFGHAVSLYRRTIAVGAPHADAGAFSPDQYHSRSFDRPFFGKGAVYIFHLQAQEQTIELRTDDPLTAGTFQLTTTYRGLTGTTTLLSYGATAAGMKAALQELSAIKLVEVTRKGTIDQGFTWSVTFIGEILQVPLLTAQWKGYGCIDCDAFSSTFKNDPSNQMRVQEVTPIGTWQQQARLEAPDSNLGDTFGGSVSLSGEQLIVGAEGSGALTTTTWDFETGDLTGWLTTGTAFDSQPTFGDNSYMRLNFYRFKPGVLPGYGQRSHYEGRYWVGTYENRRGAGKVTAEISACAFASDALCKVPDFKLPGPDPAGAIQGDNPQGTMTSQAFTILGPWLSFKIGGGCDIRLIYVELLVEGSSVMKETGRCVETMHVVKWDLAAYQNRTAQLRVVDASSFFHWGHINFDDVQFSWDVAQSSTPRAGVAYAFRRKAPASRDPCAAINRWLCDWEFQARLIASDKHTEDKFGFDVAVDDNTGIAVVSAPGQRGVDANNTIVLDDTTLQSLTGVGSVYVFKRTDEVRDGKGVLLSPPKWAPKETAKLQFPKKQAQAQYGYSVALDQTTLVVGVPFFTTSVLKPRAGQAFVYDAAFASVRFTTAEFNCVEGNVDGLVSITIERVVGSELLSTPLTVGYATEDLNAVGIDALKFQACMNVPVTQRSGCFDYQQTAGEITFAAGESSKQILVPIVDDTCYEPKPEHFIMRLNVPGGEALIGEQYVATVRIDDDDWTSDQC